MQCTRYCLFSCSALISMKKILRGEEKLFMDVPLSPQPIPSPIEEREGNKNKRYLCVFYLSSVWFGKQVLIIFLYMGDLVYWISFIFTCRNILCRKKRKKINIPKKLRKKRRKVRNRNLKRRMTSLIVLR